MSIQTMGTHKATLHLNIIAQLDERIWLCHNIDSGPISHVNAVFDRVQDVARDYRLDKSKI